MTTKTLLAALALTLLPAVSFAMGCSGKSHQTQSCGVGTVWDADTQTCVKQVSS
jgi:hypothetical protein